MLKSDLVIDPYTINEALIALNKDLHKIGRKKICINHLYLLIAKFNIKVVKVKGKVTTIEYNNIVDIYHLMQIKRYPKNRKSRCK